MPETTAPAAQHRPPSHIPGRHSASMIIVRAMVIRSSRPGNRDNNLHSFSLYRHMRGPDRIRPSHYELLDVKTESSSFNTCGHILTSATDDLPRISSRWPQTGIVRSRTCIFHGQCIAILFFVRDYCIRLSMRAMNGFSVAGHP